MLLFQSPSYSRALVLKARPWDFVPERMQLDMAGLTEQDPPKSQLPSEKGEYRRDFGSWKELSEALWEFQDSFFVKNKLLKQSVKKRNLRKVSQIQLARDSTRVWKKYSLAPGALSGQEGRWASGKGFPRVQNRPSLKRGHPSPEAMAQRPSPLTASLGATACSSFLRTRQLALTFLRTPCCWAGDRSDTCRETVLLRTCERSLRSIR